MERIAYNGFAVTFTGGDPMYSATALLPLAKRICNAGLNLWIYTGFTIEEIFSAGGDMAALADMADVIVDGPFIESLKDTRLLFRGSSNQRLVDMTATKKNGHVVEYTPTF